MLLTDGELTNENEILILNKTYNVSTSRLNVASQMLLDVLSKSLLIISLITKMTPYKKNDL